MSRAGGGEPVSRRVHGVCVGTFGATRGPAPAGVGGPLIEVPVLVALVCAALRARRRF